MAFKSGFERSIDINLKSRGKDFSYETLELPYTLHGTYHPDFMINDGSIVVEAKGVLSVDDRRKMRAVKDQYPDLDIRFLFMRANTKVKHGKMTNEQWATKNGFPFAVETIPEEWFNERQ